MDDETLAATFAALVGPIPAVVELEREAEVQRRVDELRASDEQRLQERARQIAEAMYAERDQRDQHQQDQQDQRDQRNLPKRDSPESRSTP